MIDLGRCRTLLLQTKLNTDNPQLFQLLSQLIEALAELQP